MKSIAITIFIVLIIAVLGLYLFSFQVRETESALVTTFGKATGQLTKPGWYPKWPAPIQRVHKFDSRAQVFEAEISETTTKGAVPVIVNTYVVWKIAEPLKFFNAVGTVREAENKLRSQINNTQNTVIGRHFFSEFVNSDPAKIKFEEIQGEMLAELKEAVRSDYGIEIKTLGIKQLKVSKEVTKDVFNRMSAERNRRTSAIITEGEAERRRIESDADMKKTVLSAAAETRAKSIMGAGDAEAAKYYKMLEADPELAMLLRNVEALKKVLEERSTVIFSSDSEPFKLLKEMPDIKPKKQ